MKIAMTQAIVTSRKVCDLVLLTGLALVSVFVLFAWLAGQSVSPQSHAASDMHKSHLTLEDRTVHAHPHMAADCTGSTVLCCMMSLCHPAMSSDPVEIPVVLNAHATTASFATFDGGNDPAIILPPPRQLAV